MLNEQSNAEDFATSLAPEARAVIPWRVTDVTPLQGFRLAVRFVDGTNGVVDLSEMIHSPQAGVFAGLSDADLFAQVFVEHGAVMWPGELDLAPDAMYAELRERGEWKLR